MNIAVTSCFLVILLLAPCTLAEEESWLTLSTWNEGLAEVALYEGKLKKYGILRDASVDLITVREYFHPERIVKTTGPTVDGADSLPVMKQNLTRRIRTGIYEYVQAGSTFVHRNSGELLKLSAVSTEWCGTSSALLIRNGDSGSLRISNYMDDRGFSAHLVDALENLLFYDQLIPYLRHGAGSLQPGTSLRIVDTLLSNNPVFRVRSAVIRTVERQAATKNMGAAQIEISIEFPDRTETFRFEDDPLRKLVRWENDQGEWLANRKTVFLDYWNRSQPGDEKLLN